MSSLYCFISGGRMKFVPVSIFIESVGDSNDVKGSVGQDSESTTLQYGSVASPSPTPKTIYNSKNLVYLLNNTSLSDVDCDNTQEVNCAARLPKRNSPSPSPELVTEVKQIVDEYSTHAIFLPKYSIDLNFDMNNDYSEVRNLLSKVFPQTWQVSADIEISAVTGGITNMLLSCKNKARDETILVRVYGRGTNLIIDRNREFVSHLVLRSLNLAPPLFARFKNGIVYGFLPGKSLSARDLRQPYLYPLIAQQLGNWHNKLSMAQIDDGITSLRKMTKELHKRKRSDATETNDDSKTKHFPRNISDIWILLQEWISIVPLIPELIETFDDNMKVSVNEHNLRGLIRSELEWLKNETSKVYSPMVCSHCDLLSGNVIVPDNFPKKLEKLPPVEENPIRFIDYEYMLPAPRAFDIANHFAEWQGYDCERSAIPVPSLSNNVVIEWIRAYLNNSGTDKDIEVLLKEIQAFYGTPGFFWGIWSMIQSQISNIDFDYGNYGKQRLQEYWDWKKEYQSM